MSRELIGVLKLKTIFDSGFKYIFICRFLPFWLHSPAAIPLECIPLENLLEVFSELDSFYGRACNSDLF